MCNKICIPAHGTATITLTPDGKGLDGHAVTTALADVPIPISNAERHDLTVTPQRNAAKPTWIVSWSGGVPLEDVFAVAPEGFFFDTKKLGPDRFALTAAQVVAASSSTQVPVTLTLSRGGRSVVATEMLDVPRGSQ